MDLYVQCLEKWPDLILPLTSLKTRTKAALKMHLNKLKTSRHAIPFRGGAPQLKMPTKEMSQDEIEQFMINARVGRLGLSLADGPYIVPVSYVYSNGKVFFHTCNRGLKMKALQNSPNVCFEVDESLSDASMYKSVIVVGKAEVIAGKEQMIPYLQKLIDKYRVPVTFDEYMNRLGRDREKELAAVRICVITPTKITGKKFIAKSDFHTF